MSRVFVLDAWAFVALLQKEEPAASRVRRLLQDAGSQMVKIYLSIINLGEIYYSLGKAKGRGQPRQCGGDILIVEVGGNARHACGRIVGHGWSPL